MRPAHTRECGGDRFGVAIRGDRKDDWRCPEDLVLHQLVTKARIGKADPQLDCVEAGALDRYLPVAGPCDADPEHWTAKIDERERVASCR
jgi:hypothetical protein